MNVNQFTLLVITLITLQSIAHAVPVHDAHPESPSSSPTARDMYNGLEFLRVYKYLLIDPSKDANLPSPDVIKSALVTMQRFAGLEQTGQFDNPTLKMMQKPRCGVADVIVRTDSSRFRRYNLAGTARYRWFTNDLTYKIDNYPTHSATNLNSTLSHDQVDSIIAKAFKVWSDVSPLNFTRVQSDSNKKADIHLLFGARKHTNINHDPIFDGKRGTLAHAFTPNSGWGETDGDVHFDGDETFTHKIYSGTNLFYTAAHEIGHALGLDHSDNRNALMWPYDQGYQPNFELPADDVAGIQAIYGPKPTEEPPLPVYCNTTFIAVAIIYQKLYVFSDELLWQFTLDGDLLTNPDGEAQSDHFENLPRRIQAVYERWYDGKVIFLKGKKYHIYDGHTAETPVGGAWIRKTLSNELPKTITAALHNIEDGTTDFLRGTKVWRFNEIKNRLAKGFPKPASPDVFPGLPPKPTGSFFDQNGHAVILKRRQYNKYTATNDGTYLLISDEAEPRNFATDYLRCP